MLELVFKDDVYVISELENSKNYEGTYQSLLKIKEEFKREVYFLLGADNLLYLNKWINYEKIIEEFKLIVVKRDNIFIEKYILNNFEKQKNNFKMFDCNMPLSSSSFRTNPSKSELVDEEVYQFILKNNLYGVNNNV